MAPRSNGYYSPLSVGAGEAPAIIQDLMRSPRYDFNDSLKEQYALDTQELDNENKRIVQEDNELKLEELKRQRADEESYRDSIIQKFGQGESQPFDESTLLDTLQKLSVERGDGETALKIQEKKALINYRNALAEGTKTEKANNEISEEVIQDIASKTGQDPELVRQYATAFGNKPDKLMSSLGANVSKVSDKVMNTLSSGDTADFSIKSAREFAKGFKPGFRAALNAGKITSWYSDPSTSEYKYMAEIAKLKKEVASMNESGQMTEKDVEAFGPLTEGNIFYDDNATIDARLLHLGEYINTKRMGLLDKNKKGGRNVSQFMIPKTDSSQGIAPGASSQDKYNFYKNQRAKELRAGQGG